MLHMYAHSGISAKGITPQTYESHVSNVYKYTKENSSLFDNDEKLLFLKNVVQIAALYHDLGKLDPVSQTILSSLDKLEDVKMLNHVEAGVVYCLNKYEDTKNSTYLYAAYLIHAHHIGLSNQNKLFEIGYSSFKRTLKVNNSFKCEKDISDYVHGEIGTINEYVQKQIDTYIKIHNDILPNQVKEVESLDISKTRYIPTAMDLRFALSVLVDADHKDTSIHYGMVTRKSNQLHPEKRINLIHNHIKKVQNTARKNGIPEKVIDSRNVLFNLCSTTDIDKHFYSCFGPTGKGKTLSSMMVALRLSEKYELQKIHYVIPFTNIIDQSVKVYQNSLIDETDNVKHKEYIVNPIHSMCDFNHWWLRKYSHLWDCPINVSTSVQFFESLLSNKPGRLRKIKNFANSVIVFDEYHTAMPHEYWDLALDVLQEISKKYNIFFVFSSGTQILYWNSIFEKNNIDVHDVVDDLTFDNFKKFESGRVEFHDSKNFDNEKQLYNWIRQKAILKGKLKYNTCVVMNTVMSATTVAKYFKHKYPNIIVRHMSSCLTPKDRMKILESIHNYLEEGKKVLLVATSVVECGIDFSFELGFREYASLESTIQFGGRINRNNEYKKGNVYEFTLSRSFIDNNDNFSFNPGIASAIDSREGLEVNPDNCTCAVLNSLYGKDTKSIVRHNEHNDFEDVSKKFKVINAPTQQVIIYPEIIAKMKAGEIVPSSVISGNSVNLYGSKLEKLEGQWEIETIGDRDFYVWTGNYDPHFYGIYV